MIIFLFWCHPGYGTKTGGARVSYDSQQGEAPVLAPLKQAPFVSEHQLSLSQGLGGSLGASVLCSCNFSVETSIRGCL